MKLHIESPVTIPLKKLGLVLALCCFTAGPVLPCTIFVLTEGNRVLFFNNEDWLNPKTRIWFVPPGDGYYGCAYVGYDDGWARGGLNTEGLACEWVGGFNEKWEPDARTCVRGNPTQRLLESCATIEEVIAFFRMHREPGNKFWHISCHVLFFTHLYLQDSEHQYSTHPTSCRSAH